MARTFSGALVPAVNADGSVQWQGWQYEELLAHLNNDLTISAGAFDTDAVASSLRALAGAWVAPTLSGAWTVNATVGYIKDALGWVHLRGAVATGTSATAAFTLPVGYRPAVTDFYPALQSGGVAGAFVNVSTAGVVTPTYTAAPVWLNAVHFLAEL